MKKNIKVKPIIGSIVVSTTFSQTTPDQMSYSRVDNPTRLDLEKDLANLEKAKFALSFSSGSAAMTAIFLSLKRGNHIVCHEEVYEGTLRLLEKIFKNFGIEFSLINLLNNNSIESSFKKNTKLIWFENITNPTLNTINVSRICRLAKSKKVKVVVDNTFATPFFANPLTDGVDIVVHSLTKYINGHHDVTAGAIMTNDMRLFKKLRFLQITTGVIPSPLDCFLIKRGMETFPLRMKKHQENAKKISVFLKTQKNIKKVSFPGISGMVSFWVKGDLIQTVKFIKKLKIIKIAHSFGGGQSTILHPLSMMTFSFPKERLKKIGINGALVRLSVGLEDSELIIDDLRQALK